MSDSKEHFSDIGDHINKIATESIPGKEGSVAGGAILGDGTFALILDSSNLQLPKRGSAALFNTKWIPASFVFF